MFFWFEVYQNKWWIQYFDGYRISCVLANILSKRRFDNELRSMMPVFGSCRIQKTQKVQIRFRKNISRLHLKINAYIAGYVKMFVMLPPVPLLNIPVIRWVYTVYLYLVCISWATLPGLRYIKSPKKIISWIQYLFSNTEYDVSFIQGRDNFKDVGNLYFFREAA